MQAKNRHEMFMDRIKASLKKRFKKELEKQKCNEGRAIFDHHQMLVS